MNIRRVRNFLGLTQADVAAATGISIFRLSAAENCRKSLNLTEKRALEEFYRARMQMVAEANLDGAE
jgi:hypothetical protein